MRTVVTEFIRQAELHPDSIAVLDSQGAITYDQMNNLSAYLAEQILERIGGRDRKGRIAVLLPRSKAFVVAQFAVLRAGCAVVPIDSEYPPERVRMILEDVDCALCLTNSAMKDKAESVPIILLEEIRPADGHDPEGDRTLDLSDPDAEGYIPHCGSSVSFPFDNSKVPPAMI